MNKKMVLIELSKYGNYYSTADVKDILVLIGDDDGKYLIAQNNILTLRGYAKHRNAEYIAGGVAGGLYVILDDPRLEDIYRKITTVIQIGEDGKATIEKKDYLILRDDKILKKYAHFIANLPIVYTTDNPVKIIPNEIEGGVPGYLVNVHVIEKILSEFRNDLSKRNKNKAEVQEMSEGFLKEIKKEVDTYTQTGDDFKRTDFDDVYEKPKTYIEKNSKSELNSKIDANLIELFFPLDLNDPFFTLVPNKVKKYLSNMVEFIPCDKNIENNESHQYYKVKNIIMYKGNNRQFFERVANDFHKIYLRIPNHDTELIGELNQFGLLEEFEQYKNPSDNSKYYFQRNLTVNKNSEIKLN